MPIIFDGKNFKTAMGKPLTQAEAITWSDTARAKKIPNQPDWITLKDNFTKTLQLMERAYAILDCEGYITSFFRCKDLNLAIGGKINPPSAHMDGRAFDSVPIGKNIRECFNLLKRHELELQYDQLIIEHDSQGHVWLHMAVSKMMKAPRLQALDIEKIPDVPRTQQG